MVKKLFTRFLSAGLLFASGMINNVQAQTTITTNFSPAPVLTAPATGVPHPTFITFSVTNNNACPVTLTQIDYFCVGLATLSGKDFSNNGASFTLWYAPNPAQATGAPNITILTGWNVAGLGNPVFNANSGGSIIPVISGLNLTIPPNTTYRLALSADDTIAYAAYVPQLNFVSNGVTLTNGGGNIYTGSMPGPGTNTVTVTPPGGITNPSFIGSIHFIAAGTAAPAPPTLTANSLKICKNSDLILTATVPSYITNPVYTFYGPNGLPVQTGASNTYTKINMQPSDAGTYTCRVTDANCASAQSLPAAVRIEVIATPAPKYEGKTDFCLNEPFLPVNVIGNGIKWYYTATGGSPIPFVPPFNTTTVNEDTFYVTMTENGCESEFRTMVPYRATPKPAPPIVSTPVFYCENSPASPLNATGSQLRWYYEPIGGISSVIAPTPNTTAKDTFNYYVTQTNRGCESNRALIKAIVTFRPNGLILSSKDQLCQNDTLTLTYYGSAFPGSAYNWNFPTGSVILSSDVNFAGPLVIRLDSAGYRDIKLQVGSDGCYSEMYAKTIQIDTLPTAVIENRPNICQGQTELISLSSYTLSTDSFFWSWDGGRTTHYATDQGPYGLIWDNPGKKMISLRLVNKLCSNTMIDSLIVQPKPSAAFDIDGYQPAKPFCSGDSLRMTAKVISPTSSYSWSPTRFFDNYSTEPSTFGRVDFTSMIKLNVTDQYGCTSADSLKVTVKACCDVNFPSAFSPNGDGKNDVFRVIPRPMGEQRQFDVRSFKVVNRYGQVVFETADELKGWDGNLNGKPLDMGSYFYYIGYKCDGKMMEVKGEVILVR